MSLESLQEQQAEASKAMAAGNFEQAVKLYDQILSESERHPDPTAIHAFRLKALIERGRLLRLLGQQEASLASYEQHYLEAGDMAQAVEALVNIGIQSIKLGQHRRGMEAMDEALLLAEAFDNAPGRARALGTRGSIQISMGQIEEGMKDCELALSLCQQLSDLPGQMNNYNRLGVSHARLGALDKAIASFKASLQIARELEHVDGVILALGNLGEAYQDLYDMSQALLYHREGLSVAEENGLAHAATDIIRNLGVDLVHLGHVEGGLRHLNRALKQTLEHNQKDFYVQALASLGWAEFQYGKDIEKGYRHIQQLEKVAKEQEAKGGIVNALYLQGMYHHLKGNLTLAQQRWQEAAFLAHETGDRQLLWQSHAALADISGPGGLAKVHYRIAAEVILQIAYPIEDMYLRRTFLSQPHIEKILLAADMRDEEMALPHL